MKRLAVALFIAPSAHAYGQDVETTIRKNTIDFNLAYENNELDEYFGYYAEDTSREVP